MVALTRNNSGQWAARKVIPADIRSAYGKREEKKTWPAALSQAQAKAEYASWLTLIEERIAMLRAMADQTPVALSQRQTRALAGEWYKAKKAQHEENPGQPEGWWFSRDELEPDDNEQREAGRIQPTGWLIEERDALLLTKGLTLTPSSGEALLQEMGDLWLSLCALMERRAQGDYGPDPLADTLPALEAAPAKTDTVAVSITQLFEDYATARKPSPHTERKWRTAVAKFVAHIGHDDATKVTRADASGWFTALVAGGLTVKTVAMTYRAALSRVFKVAYDRGQLSENPFARLEVIGPKVAQTQRKSLSDDEAMMILAAALGEQPAGLSPTHARARRWVPWVCAYTGARVNEITQLRAMDIRQVDGVWVIHILKTKTDKARMVPLHSHLIEQGFHKLGKAGDATPLFYDPNGIRKGSESHPLHEQMGGKLAKWVRGLGVTEVESPNHGWRHRFKTLARKVGMDSGARDAIQGHAARTEAENYGEWDMETLRAELEKLDRYAT
ncbi:tyrosine-type recombinase/integrase [Erythrobacter sp. T5W1-R]|uniref:tyrosine-type recombinase/integrase n=1 Tax=Erythrobacter sp. T5W1-R TaxID=3101752 RepID=UPI002AFE6A78|nr:tyrosine-type recombinase/integrase [Erythrobacter sp. T5W1-R]MEA1618685.1 tyrosine-type recombinase/integrase [Erythrobacter sp. T5W1-R]